MDIVIKIDYICIVMKDLLIGAITGAVIAIAILIWGAYCGYRNQKHNKIRDGANHSKHDNNPDWE